MSEIGFETANLFKQYLNNKMNIIMPYYNMLYELQNDLLKSKSAIDQNVNITETYEHNTSSESSSNSSSKSNSDGKSVSQDTPQGELKNQDINNYNYADNINFSGSNSSINDTSTNNGKSIEDYIKKIQGNNGNKYAYEVLITVKNNLLSIDMEVIKELEDLFMSIF